MCLCTLKTISLKSVLIKLKPGVNGPFAVLRMRKHTKYDSHLENGLNATNNNQTSL